MFCISFDFPDYSDLLDSPKSFDFTDCSCLCARHIYSFTRYVLVNRQWGDNIETTGAGYGASFEYPIVFTTKVLAVIPFDVNGGWIDEAIPPVHAAWFPNEGSDGNDLR